MGSAVIESKLSAAIFGCAGEKLTVDEKAFFKDINPYGYILFARNCHSPEQVRSLTDSLRELSGNDQLPILIDQEGGRVARLKEPHWWTPPAAGLLATLNDDEGSARAIYLVGKLIASQLAELGITVNCAPLADIPVEGSHEIIGDRAYGDEPEKVTRLARAMAEGLHAGGVISVLKHIPGHGRALVDSHHDLPVVKESMAVLESTDFVPFKNLSDLPMGMTAHIVYKALDEEHVATMSPRVIDYIRNIIGFDGLLMSDDLSMKALTGDFSVRAKLTLDAGCDLVLHCNGDMVEMQQIAQGLEVMTAKAVARDQAAWEQVRRAQEGAEAFEVKAAKEELASFLSTLQKASVA